MPTPRPFRLILCEKQTPRSGSSCMRQDLALDLVAQRYAIIKFSFLGIRPMAKPRLGDIIDDHCPKCRLMTNHSIVAIVDETPAKVECRTCFHAHSYRHGKSAAKKKKARRPICLTRCFRRSPAAGRKRRPHREAKASRPPPHPAPSSRPRVWRGPNSAGRRTPAQAGVARIPTLIEWAADANSRSETQR